MATINQLSATDTLTGGDLLPVYVSNNGDARKASITLLKTYMQNNLTFPAATGIAQFVPQYASPAATGFTITMTSSGDNAWLIITPLAGYAAGTIVFPLLADCDDNQEIIFTTTQSVAALTINGNGATVIGAPSTLVQFSGARFKFNALVSAWYRIDGEGSNVANTVTAQTFTAQQTLTGGLVIQTATAASIAAIANAINTTNKVAGKVVYDTTNNRIMIASGALTSSAWYVADGSASVVPA